MLKLCAFLFLSLATPVLADSPEIEKVVASPIFEVRLGSALAPLAADRLPQRTVSIRRQMLMECGWILPAVRFVPDAALGANRYKILSNGTAIGEAQLEANQLLAIGPEGKLANLSGPLVKDPTYGLPGKWIAPGDQAKAEQMGFMVFDPVSVWATQMTELCRTRSADLYTADHLQAGLAALRKTQPVLVERLSGDAALRDKLLAVVRNLLAERVPARDLEMLAELMLASPQATAENISEAARVELAGLILKDLANQGRVSATLVGPKLEAAVVSNATPDRVLKAVTEAVTAMQDQGLAPALVTTSAARLKLRRLTQKDFPNLVVLSRQELVPYYPVIKVGEVEI